MSGRVGTKRRCRGPATVVCTTVVRHAAPGMVHGQIVEVDWETGNIVHRLDVPPPRGELVLLTLNPRGGARGGRGVRITEDAVYVANDNTVIKYDRAWTELCRVSHQLLTGLHEIEVTGDGIWVSSTGIDAAIKLDSSGHVLRTWSPRTDRYVKARLGITDKYQGSWPPAWVGWGYLDPWRVAGFLVRRLAARLGVPVDRSRQPWHVLSVEPRNRVEQWLWTAYRAVPALSPNEFHLNCVRVYRDEVYVTLLNWPWRTKACLLRIEPDVHIEFGSKDIGMPHNAQILDEGHLIVNDTEKQALKVFARSTGELVNHISCAEMGIEGKAWLRGLKPLGNRRVLVGAGAWSSVVGEPDWRRTIPPAQIMEVDLEAREVSRRVVVSDKGLTSIHGLDAFP